ncbi:MAG: YSC84-related protein [Patiriisocius sp.]|uniref:lipid-binding SYLF domain-containing protein n=1 Tax=Patiriisocius sp. TaxID=2822396 RepID=UPI003EF34EFE
MKIKNLILSLVLLVGLASFAQNKDDMKIIKAAEEAKAEMLKSNPEIQSYFDSAKVYAIFPNVGKGAMIIGAASGNGVVYERGVLVGMADLKQLDIGAQIGGEGYSEIIFMNTDVSVQNFMDNDLELTSQVSAIALQKDATINGAYDDGVAVFTLTKGGLMAEVSVGGQKFRYSPINQ